VILLIVTYYQQQRGQRQTRRARQCANVLVALALLLPAVTYAQAQPQEQQSGNVIRFVRNPDPAPDFKLDDLTGRPLSLAGSHGKVILLNFWATWCGPCREEIPDLIALQKRYKDRLQIIGISVDDDDPDVVKKVVDQTGINYPVALASPEVRMAYGGIVALPTSFVLDSEGRVVQKHEGLRDPMLYEVEVRALLGMPIPARVETFEDNWRDFSQARRSRRRTSGSRFFKVDARTKAGCTASLQCGNLHLRLQIHVGAMPHLRPRLCGQQGKNRENRRGGFRRFAANAKRHSGKIAGARGTRFAKSIATLRSW